MRLLVALFLAAASGLRAEMALSPTAEAPTLPVICYHRFGEADPFDPLQLTPQELEQQLRWLKAEGFESVGLEQARAFLAGKTEGLPAKPVMLTIDDGYKNGWSVAGPLFKRHGFKAVYFLIADQVGLASTFLGWKDVQALLAEGHEVGSHTSWHSNLGRPKAAEEPQAYAARLRYELDDSRAKLEARLGITVTALAYPYGAFNTLVEAEALRAGYDLVFSVSGGVNVPGDSPLRIRRILLMDRVNFGLFRRRVGERRLAAQMEGLEEGMAVYGDELPHQIKLRLPAGYPPGTRPRAEIQGKPFRLERDPGGDGWNALLEKGMKPAFYFLKIEAGEGPQLRKDAFLFQVFKPEWRAHFAAAAAPASPSAAVLSDALTNTAKGNP